MNRDDSWTARCRSPVPIRCRGPLHFYSARDAESDRPRVVAIAPRLSPDARARLVELARVHRLVAGDHVPAVSDCNLDSPSPWVALDCDAIADLETADDFVRHGGERAPFRHGASLGKTIMETLVRVHAIRDPRTNDPIVLGALSTTNVMFAGDGRMWIVGFGAGPLADACVAPDVAAGAAPSVGGDVFAMLFFLRSQMAFVELPDPMVRVFAGRPQPEDVELVRLLVGTHAQLLVAPPSERPSMAAALEHAHALWRELGFVPDVAAFAAWIAQAIALGPDATVAVDRAVANVRVGRDGEWLEIDGARTSLATRRPLRRLLVALADARRAQPGAALATDDLLRAGWPGEDPLPEAGANRVYVAVSTLRRLGLGERLQRTDEGYRIDPDVACEIDG